MPEILFMIQGARSTSSSPRKDDEVIISPPGETAFFLSERSSTYKKIQASGCEHTACKLRDYWCTGEGALIGTTKQGDYETKCNNIMVDYGDRIKVPHPKPEF